MNIGEIIKKTAGGSHAWYQSDIGPVRKPIGIYTISEGATKPRKFRDYMPPMPWWKRLWRYFWYGEKWRW